MNISDLKIYALNLSTVYYTHLRTHETKANIVCTHFPSTKINKQQINEIAKVHEHLTQTPNFLLNTSTNPRK